MLALVTTDISATPTVADLEELEKQAGQLDTDSPTCLALLDSRRTTQYKEVLKGSSSGSDEGVVANHHRALHTIKYLARAYIASSSTRPSVVPRRWRLTGMSVAMTLTNSLILQMPTTRCTYSLWYRRICIQEECKEADFVTMTLMQPRTRLWIAILSSYRPSSARAWCLWRNAAMHNKASRCAIQAIRWACNSGKPCDS